MKKLYLLLLPLIIIHTIQAQECNAYALHWDLDQNKEFITELDPTSGEVIKLDSIPDVAMVQHGFSAINPDQGIYYFHGLEDGNSGKLYSLNLQDGSMLTAVDFPPSNINGNIIEMHYHPFTNLLYALHWDIEEEMEYFISINPQNGEVIKIQSLANVHLIQMDYSALDHLNDRYYFMGIDDNNDARLYTIDINTGSIIFDPLFSSNELNGGVNELEVNPWRGTLYSLHYDQVESLEYFVQINPETASVTKLGSLPSIQFIQSGFSAINTLNGEYYFYGIDENGDGVFHTVDIFSGEITNSVDIYGDFNGGLKELQFPNISPVIPNISQTAICDTDSALILAPEEFSQYNWSNGSTEDHIYISDSSQYNLILTKDYGCYIEIEPMPLQVYDCDEYVESILEIHDTCFFDATDINMTFISNQEIIDDLISIDWNFISIHADTIMINSVYEFNENGLYEVIIGFDCENKSEIEYYSDMLVVDHLTPTYLNEPTQHTEVSLFPNPSQGILTINTKSLPELSKLKIYNSIHQLLIEKDITENSMRLDIEEWPKGIYLVNISNENSSQTIKLIKN